MNRSRCAIPASILHRPLPVRAGFALRYEHVVSCPTRHQKIGRITTNFPQWSAIAVRLPGLIIASTQNADIQIAIDS
jgi:hypothetical protein